MPLDPQAKAVIEENAALGLPQSHELPPVDARKQMLDLSPPVDPLLLAARVVNENIPGPGGDIPVRLYYPGGRPPFPTLVYFHGGGWVIGGIGTHNALCHALSTKSRRLVVSVDYRLAPEHPYPAAVEDAYAAVCWIGENGKSVDADATRLAVMGDSAGGNLATVACIMIRDKGGPGISLQILNYPVTDYRFDTASYENYAEGHMLTRDAMMWFWDQYIVDKKEVHNPYASPLRAEDLSRLPEALIITAGYDPLRDEGEAYAERLKAAGVTVTLSRYYGMIHGFFRMTARLDKAKEALQEVADALNRLLKS